MDFDRMLRYCAALELNNDRAWFHEHHDEYDAARKDFIALVDDLKYKIADLTTPDLAERLIFVNAKDLLYRIPRDARVYKHQPPYNPSLRAYIAGDRHSVRPVGYFLMIAPGDRSLFGTGAWCPDRETLHRVRRYISEHSDRFLDLAEACPYPVTGDRLQRVPKDYDPADPAAEYLKHKDEWLIAEHFKDAQLTDFAAFTRKIARAVKRMEPLRQFFDAALVPRAE